MRFEVFHDAGAYRWRLIGHDGQQVAVSSEAFGSTDEAVRAAETVRATAASATIADERGTVDE